MLFAVRQSWVFRFMLSDGSTLDVVGDRDDSDLRTAVVEHTKLSIAGVAQIAPDDRRVPVKPEAQKTSSRGKRPASGSSGG